MRSFGGGRPRGMGGAYSQDLRDRVIDAVVGGRMSRRGAAARFGVSLSSAIKWVQRFERTGSPRPRRPGGAARFGVSLSSAIKWVQRFERTGSRSAARMGGYKRVKMEPHREFL